ncbi:hypothetical protein H6P81_019691 [Aristolochia fimbriata]|uniref:Uncharacterized protein n=1 Tax=Aristolochia fimbriata TaxID=158543 RepID=A0AAV7DVI3_ARIFI|nr:hypothetical protein H6P81_019691 [Aristolochia fimbriata]
MDQSNSNGWREVQKQSSKAKPHSTYSKRFSTDDYIRAKGNSTSQDIGTIGGAMMKNAQFDEQCIPDTPILGGECSNK